MYVLVGENHTETGTFTHILQLHPLGFSRLPIPHGTRGAHLLASLPHKGYGLGLVLQIPHIWQPECAYHVGGAGTRTLSYWRGTQGHIVHWKVCPCWGIWCFVSIHIDDGRRRECRSTMRYNLKLPEPMTISNKNVKSELHALTAMLKSSLPHKHIRLIYFLHIKANIECPAAAHLSHCRQVRCHTRRQPQNKPYFWKISLIFGK